MNFTLSLTQWILIIIFFIGLYIGIPAASEAVGVYIGINYRLPEPVSMLLFGSGMVCIAGFARKNLLRK